MVDDLTTTQGIAALAAAGLALIALIFGIVLAIKLTEVLASIAAGETKPVEMPVAARPPTGQNVPVTVEVDAVPGEKKTDNNKGSFSVIFTG